MKRIASIFRATMRILFFGMVLLAIAGMIVVHNNLIGSLSREKVQQILSDYLQSRVDVGELEISWLNQVVLDQVTLYDQQDDTLLFVRRAMVGFEPIALLHHKLELTTLQVIDFDARLYNDSLRGGANYQFLVDALAPKQNDNQRVFIDDFQLHSLHLRQGRIRYNNLDFSAITATGQIGITKDEGLEVKLKRLSLHEANGLDLKGNGYLLNDSLQVHLDQMLLNHEFEIQDLPELPLLGKITYAPIELQLKGNATVNLQHPEQAIYEVVIDHAITQLDSVGTVSIDGHCKGIGLDRITFDGDIKSSGRISSKLDAIVQYQNNQPYPLTLDIEGNIGRIPYGGRVWSQLEVLGHYANDNAEAFIRSNDPLCRLSGDATIEGISQKDRHMTFDADIVHFKPYDLHLLQWEKMADISMSGHLKGELTTGSDLLPTGHVQLNRLTLFSPTDTLHSDPIQLNMQREGETFIGLLSSPFIHCVATPSAVIGYLPPNEPLAKILQLPAALTQQATFTAEWDSVKHHIRMEADAPELSTQEGKITAHLTADGLTTDTLPIPQNIDMQLALDYITPTHLFSTVLSANVEPEPLNIVLKPSEMTFDGHPFNLSNAIIGQRENHTYTLRNFSLQNGDQQLSAQGELGKDGRLDLDLKTNDFQLDFFFDLLGYSYLTFGGYSTGELQVSSVPMMHFETENMQIRDFKYLGKRVGDSKISCFYDLSENDLYLEADIENDTKELSHASGEVRMGGEKVYVDFLFEANNLSIDFLDYWVGGFLQDMHGTAHGDVRLIGRSDQLRLEGEAQVKANFTNDLLGGRFYLNDTIYLESNDDNRTGLIALRNARISDRQNQDARISVNVNHEHLSDITYDLELNIPQSNNGFMLYDHPTQQDNELYWGQLFATGRCQMRGNTQRHHINAQLATAGKSVLYLSPGEENFSDNSYNFLTFRNKANLTYSGDEWEMLSRVRTLNNETDGSSTYIDANLQVHANDRLLVNIQLDPLAEDRLICRGEGDFSLHYDTNHDLTVTGPYNLNNGNYTITMKGDLMAKSFQIERGSQVRFSGSPSAAELNIKAKYSIPSANLRDLDESFATLASLSRTTLPVDCKLNVTGTMNAPQIAFDLEVKNVSDDIQALVHNIIGSQEMLNREVFYLLLFSKFYTPEYATTTQSNSGSEITSFASATLSSQLNNMLGHLSDNFTLGTNFRSEKGDFSDMEMDLTLQTRLFSDRLLLSGNLGYRDPANRIGLSTNNNNSFIGDFDVEFLMNTSGTLRAKAYSHYNERDYSINNALTTQGIGFIVRKDFNDLKELFNLGKKGEKSKK